MSIIAEWKFLLSESYSQPIAAFEKKSFVPVSTLALSGFQGSYGQGALRKGYISIPKSITRFLLYKNSHLPSFHDNADIPFDPHIGKKYRLNITEFEVNVNYDKMTRGRDRDRGVQCIEKGLFYGFWEGETMDDAKIDDGQRARPVLQRRS